jgi:hypothetical protein
MKKKMLTKTKTEVTLQNLQEKLDEYIQVSGETILAKCDKIHALALEDKIDRLWTKSCIDSDAADLGIRENALEISLLQNEIDKRLKRISRYIAIVNFTLFCILIFIISELGIY